jgi:hypothetical protein
LPILNLVMKKFLWLALGCLVVAGAWFLVRSRSISLSGTNLGLILGQKTSSTAKAPGALPAGSDPLVQAGERITSASAQTIGGAVAAGKDIVTGGYNAVGGVIKDWASNAYNAVTDAGRNSLGLATGTGENISSDQAVVGVAVVGDGEATAPPVGQIVAIGQSITFFVNGAIFTTNNISEISCTIDWGDGNSEDRILHRNGTDAPIAHAFGQAGEYHPLFTLGTGSSTTTYSLTIRVGN